MHVRDEFTIHMFSLEYIGTDGDVANVLAYHKLAYDNHRQQS